MLVGLTIAFVAFRNHALLEMAIGLSAPRLSLAICFLINYNQRSPTPSDRSNTIIITAYAMVEVPTLLFAIVQQLKRNRSKAGVYSNPMGADKHGR